MCKELSSPPQEIIEREVDGLVDYFCERSLGFRLRLMVFGPSGGGKTSFVQSICSGVAHKAESPTDGLDVTCWWPFRGTKNDSLFQQKLTAGERSLAVEIWDLSGRPVCQRCLHMFITPATLPVIVFNLADSESCDAVVQYADFIQSRVPGWNFVLVGTHSDELYAEDKRSGQSRRVLEALNTRNAQYIKVYKEEIANIEKLSGKKTQQHCKDRIQHLKKRLEGLPKGPPQLITVSTLTSKGLEEAKKAILSTILEKKNFPHLRYDVRPETTKVFEEILTLRKKNVLLVPKHELDAIFKQNGVLSSAEGSKDDVKFLQDAGAIYPFAFPTARGSAYSSDIICVDPTSMARALHAVHLDTSSKDFRFESKRFWPKAATTKKPAPSVLVKALEEVATQGLVRECLLPLICQSLQLDESQILHLIDLLTKLGVLLKETKESTDDQFSCLELPSYRSLSTRLVYHLPLLGLMPQNGPTLNWTPKPFRGDVQLGWRYRFQLGTPPGLVAQLLAYCRSRVRQTSYQHQWRSGLLLKIGQVRK
nr:leucine-rich repeat serine/threonine-protein kinase 2-like [Lytechinus pictus]